ALANKPAIRVAMTFFMVYSFGGVNQAGQFPCF
ncbi:hypothetical protein AAKU55_003498, partial [Oxalobacteraceae bacterium GrIS 1.11]